MPTKKLKKHHRQFLEAFGKSVERRILNDLEYKSLDEFSLIHHEEITKKTLYSLCKGRRNMKMSTLLGLANALNITPSKLLKDIQ